MTGTGTRSRPGIIALCFCILMAAAPSVAPHSLQDASLPDVGVDERPSAPLPLDLSFTNQEGKRVRLGQYFTGGPVILTLNYYSCPTLCPIIFRNLSNTINGIKGLSLERDYRIVTLSIDPRETVARADAKAGETFRMLRGIAEPGKRWQFLLGGEQEIGQVTRAVGVRYTRIGKEFAHPAVIVILTPAGKVARYLYGIEQSPADLKLALIDATAGRIGGSTLLNRVILYCYHYDPVEKKYALAAINVMKIGGGIVLLLTGVLLLSLWRREKSGTGTGSRGRNG